MKYSAHERTFLYLFGILFFLLLICPQSADASTLKDFMSYAFPGNLVVSHARDDVAWIFNWQGKRNIWIAEGPEYKARPLTQYDEDDGQELGGLSFSADGALLVYVRGGAPNRSGEYPNPTSNPAGVEQAVWALDISNGKSWRIGQGSDPVLSPVDNRVVFSTRSGMFICSLEENARPKSLFRARGRNGSPRWSPDGSKIVFVSSREDHSFIGVFDLEKDTISWVSPSVDMDGYPVWSGSGKQLAFIRFPAFTSTFRGGARFTICVADLESGGMEEIWSCPNATGGFSQYYPAEPLRWAAGDQLVFYSEHENWMHLYSLSIGDKKVTSLTPGEFEVEDSFLSQDRTTLFFNSNSGDIDRRHIWSVSVQGEGKARLLTKGTGIEWAPVLTPVSQDLVFLCSTARQPAAPAVLEKGSGSPVLIAPKTVPAEFPLDELVEPEQIIFQAPDGLEIHGQLFLPEGAKPGSELPAVIFMHGGPIRQMLLGWHMRGYYHNAYALNQYLAAQGYVVLSVNYRSGIGYGFDFRNAPNQGPRGASEYQDIVAAGKYLQNRPDVDPNKVGLWGGSYGGYLTAMGLARDSELFAAGVDLHGVHDWALRGQRRDGGGWGITQDLMSIAFQSSPVADVDFWTSPVLFVHGDDDRNVDFVQTTDLVQRLRRLGKAQIELLIIPDEVHGFLRHANWLSVYEKTVDFFNRFLKGE